VPNAQNLLSTLMAADAGRPRVTWYGAGGERVELSAKTLTNWVSKTANLLADELDAGPGTTVVVELPAHWRTLVWLLATWSVGAHAVVGGTGTEGDVLVTDEPRQTAARLVAVALPALATRWPGDLPGGAVDAATEVRLQPDAFSPPETPDGSDPALTAAGTTVTYQELFATAGTPDRLLTAQGPQDARAAYLAPLLGGGSVVLYDGTALGADAVARIRSQEGVTTG
jgi:uncharacterized protein (TIGR03089 family)